MSTLLKIRDAGFQVELLNDSFKIEPASKLTQSQRDFLKQHKAEIISELQAEQLAASVNINLNPEHRKLLMDYMAAIGETDVDLIDELLGECSQSQAKLNWALSWAMSIIRPKSNQRKTSLVKCGNCCHWRGHYQHQRGPGSCAVWVQPAGACHWFDTPKECEQWTEYR